MSVISTAVIVNETEVHELKSKGAWQARAEFSAGVTYMHTSNHTALVPIFLQGNKLN